jgi:hypothetical protein
MIVGDMIQCLVKFQAEGEFGKQRQEERVNGGGGAAVNVPL